MRWIRATGERHSSDCDGWQSERAPEQQVERALSPLTEPGCEVDGPERTFGTEEKAAPHLKVVVLDVIACRPGVTRLEREPEIGRELEQARAATADPSENDGSREPVLRAEQRVARQPESSRNPPSVNRSCGELTSSSRAEPPSSPRTRLYRPRPQAPCQSRLEDVGIDRRPERIAIRLPAQSRRLAMRREMCAVQADRRPDRRSRRRCRSSRTPAQDRRPGRAQSHRRDAVRAWPRPSAKPPTPTASAATDSRTR